MINNPFNAKGTFYRPPTQHSVIITMYPPWFVDVLVMLPILGFLGKVGLGFTICVLFSLMGEKADPGPPNTPPGDWHSLPPGESVGDSIRPCIWVVKWPFVFSLGRGCSDPGPEGPFLWPGEFKDAILGAVRSHILPPRPTLPVTIEKRGHLD